ncbi:hypothetical protein [Corynebacterium efficiens]|uniref:hypothetical protein n=1 Tax=Corynebacterium efficiens TaxID=152794 RepID=UPI001E2D0B84|nr:hypothetical protein [Corynebacterium efficiens]
MAIEAADAVILDFHGSVLERLGNLIYAGAHLRRDALQTMIGRHGACGVRLARSADGRDHPEVIDMVDNLAAAWVSLTMDTLVIPEGTGLFGEIPSPLGKPATHTIIFSSPKRINLGC